MKVDTGCEHTHPPGPHRQSFNALEKLGNPEAPGHLQEREHRTGDRIAAPTATAPMARVRKASAVEPSAVFSSFLSPAREKGEEGRYHERSRHGNGSDRCLQGWHHPPSEHRFQVLPPPDSRRGQQSGGNPQHEQGNSRSAGRSVTSTPM